MIFTIRWDSTMGCYRVSVPNLDTEGTGVEVVVVMDLLSEQAIDAACNEIWPLDGLSSDEARDELRRDMRQALTVAMQTAASPPLTHTPERRIDG